MQDPYQTLGINRNATPDEIKRAYRKLASQHHPDRGGDTKKFQEIQVAYDSLTNPQKQQSFDHPFGGGFGFRADAPFDFETIFNVFGTRFNQANQNSRRQLARMTLWITLRDAAEGGNRTISIGTNTGTHAVEIEIPRGINDGESVKYPNMGIDNLELLITYRIHPDPRFQRQDLNLFTETTVSIWDLVLGAETLVKDLMGNTLSMSIAPKTQPGTMVRLRGRGLSNKMGQVGDLLVRIQARIPETIDDELVEMIRQKNPK